jgi:thioredoxin-dependent peroxiredoxin
MASIRVGDFAPDVSGVIAGEGRFRLADFRERRVVVLFFYPSDGTLICTQEACAFRDAYADFVEAGAVVIGVSGDSEASHRQFADAHQLPYVLVSDPQGAIREAFGVPKTIGIFPGRTTYVIDKEGVVRLVFNAALAAKGHVREALQVVKQLAQQA